MRDSFVCSEGAQLKDYVSSPVCTRKFCINCGTHVYIEYSDENPSDRWAGEIHFPTALLDDDGVRMLELVGATSYILLCHQISNPTLICNYYYCLCVLFVVYGKCWKAEIFACVFIRQVCMFGGFAEMGKCSKVRGGKWSRSIRRKLED